MTHSPNCKLLFDWIDWSSLEQLQINVTRGNCAHCTGIKGFRFSEWMLANVGGKSRACCHAVIPYINTKAYQETGAVEFSLKFSSQVVNQWPACQLWSRISRQGGQGKSACISRHDVDFSCLQSVSATPRTLPPPDSKNQLYFPKVGNCICICSVSISLAHSYLDRSFS